jgi:hypothetical protein
MTDPENEDGGEFNIEVTPPLPVMLNDGDFAVLDADYLDVSLESQGVLAILHSLERGQWVLIGRGGDGEPYTQTWERIGADTDAAKPRGKLKPVN